MPTFYLYRKQCGEGCDYAIGCAQDLSPMEAQTIEEARIEAASACDDNEIERCYIIPTLAVEELDVAEHYRQKRVEREEQERAAQEQRERDEFVRLARKFQGGGI